MKALLRVLWFGIVLAKITYLKKVQERVKKRINGRRADETVHLFKNKLATFAA